MTAVADAVALQCSSCSGPRCEHDLVLARFLGVAGAELCHDCLCEALALDPVCFAGAATAHLRKKACLWAGFERVKDCGCRLGEAATRSSASVLSTRGSGRASR